VSRPERVLDRLAADIRAALGEDLVSLAVHGSWVFGDFTPGRSDLDLLAVLATDPTASLLTQLGDMHAGIERDHRDWAGHIEVDYVSSSAVADVVRGVARSHPMIRISPGEAIHMLTASRSASSSST
jgi:predicted nucleotidyltransferase